MNACFPLPVTSVYSGKAGKCCCGCSGSHRYASRLADKGVELRGYALSAKEINDVQVKKVYGLVVANAADPSFELDSNNASVVLDGRLFIAYFRGL